MFNNVKDSKTHKTVKLLILSTNESKQLYHLKMAYKVFMTNFWLVKSS